MSIIVLVRPALNIHLPFALAGDLLNDAYVVFQRSVYCSLIARSQG